MSVCVRFSQQLEPMAFFKRFRVFCPERLIGKRDQEPRQNLLLRDQSRAPRDRSVARNHARASRFFRVASCVHLAESPPRFICRGSFSRARRTRAAGEAAVLSVPTGARAHVEARAHRCRLEPRARPPGRSRRRAEGWPSSWDRAGSVSVRSSPFERDKHHGRPVAASEAPRGPRPPA